MAITKLQNQNLYKKLLFLVREKTLKVGWANIYYNHTYKSQTKLIGYKICDT